MFLSKNKIKKQDACPWFMPIILANWKAVIRKITIPGQPGQKKFARPHLYRKKKKKPGCVARTCHHR
jgi:hypothetical protein